MSRWADEVDDEEYGEGLSIPTQQEVIVKDGERKVAEIKVDPDTGKKIKIVRTFRLEKKLGMLIYIFYFVQYFVFRIYIVFCTRVIYNVKLRNFQCTMNSRTTSFFFLPC